MVWQIIGVIAAMWLLWKTMSLALRLGGWALIGLGVLNAGNAPDVMGTIVTVALGAVALVAGHGVFYLRRGYWKPRIIQALLDRHDDQPSGAESVQHRPGDPHRHFRAPRPHRPAR